MSKKGRPNQLVDSENNAWCSECYEEKPKKEFYRNKSRSTGLDSRCKKCNHSNKRERNRRKNDEKHNVNIDFPTIDLHLYNHNSVYFDNVTMQSKLFSSKNAEKGRKTPEK